MSTSADATMWLTRLSDDLDARQASVGLYEAYYEGEHNLRFATRKFREAFGALFREFADNWCEVVIDAPVERLAIQGFRFGADPNDQTGDKDAWEMWQRNSLDCDSEIAHTQALIAGEAAIIVGPPEAGDTPLITVEHPSQVIVRTAASNRRTRLAALKRWFDEETERMLATIYLPDGIYKFQSAGTYKSGGDAQKVQWKPRDGESFTTNPLNVVPVVPLRNKETLLGGGGSDLKQVIPMQDLVNKLLTDMTVASEYAAFRQRVAIGIEVPKDDDGNPLPQEQFLSSVSRMWVVEDPNVKFQEFQASDLTNYVKAIVMCRNHIAARTRTPPHYLLGEIVNASGSALKAAETGLVCKVRRRSRFFGEAWEEAMRLAFALKGDDTRAKAYGAETIWRNPETITDSELMDSLAKMAALGVPMEALWERAGATPQEVERWKAMLEAGAAVPGAPSGLGGVTGAPGALPAIPTEPAPAPLAALLRAAGMEGM